MIICDETCGEEAILAARLAPLAAGRVGAGTEPARRGRARRRGARSASPTSHTPRRRGRGAAQLRRRVERGRRRATNEWGLPRGRTTRSSAGGRSAPSAMWPPDSGASRRRFRPSTVGTTGRPLRGGRRSCCRRRCDPSTAGVAARVARHATHAAAARAPRAAGSTQERLALTISTAAGRGRGGGRRPQVGGGRGDSRRTALVRPVFEESGVP